MRKRKIWAFVLSFLLLFGIALYNIEPNENKIALPEISKNIISPELKKEVLNDEKIVVSSDFETSDKVLPETGLQTVEVPEMEEIQPFCTLTVRCDDVLENMDKLSEAKKKIIPHDGMILPKEKIFFSEGESAFDILLRVTRERGIHMEFVNTPMYNSAYIEGIGNIYEFDLGETAGWTYTVNGERPMYGCSQHQVKNGDNIEFIYILSLY